jgi:hypothetical protein
MVLPESSLKANKTGKHLAKGKHKYTTNKSQCKMVTSEPSTTATTNAGYHNRPKEQDYDLQSHLMKKVIVL